MPPEVAPVKSANPAPLGLAGFGLTTVVLSAINAGLLPQRPSPSSSRWPSPTAESPRSSPASSSSAPATPSEWSPSPPTASSGGGSPSCKWTIGAGWLKAPPPAAGGSRPPDVGSLHLPALDRHLPPQQGGLEHLPAALDHLLPPRRGRLRLSAPRKIGGYFGLLTGLDALFVAFIEVLNATAGRERHPPRHPHPPRLNARNAGGTGHRRSLRIDGNAL